MVQWEIIKLGDILTESKTESPYPDVESRIRVLLNAKGVVKRPIQKETKGATKYFIRKKGQFIYGKQNIHKGAFGIIPDELDGYESTSDLPAFDVNYRCLPSWIEYFMKQGNFYLSLVNIARGVATKRVQPKEFLEVEIPLPSVIEQKKIISHFKSIETKDDKLKKELNHQQILLKKLRQQILQEAIEGKLTAEWRQENPDVEPASELLTHIQAEKAQLIKNKKIKKQKPLPPISEKEKSFSLPEGWVWCRMQDITRLITDGKHGDCQNMNNSGYYFLSAKDIQNGELLYINARQIDPVQFQEVHNRTDLEAGDICMVNTGATVGKLAIAPDSTLTQKTTFQKSVAVIKVVKPLVDQKFISMFLTCETTKLLATSWGSAINNLLLGDLKKKPVPFPPLPEQQAIVAKVENLLALCDELENQITTNQTHADQLMQAVLREAFSHSSGQQNQEAVNA